MCKYCDSETIKNIVDSYNNALDRYDNETMDNAMSALSELAINEERYRDGYGIDTQVVFLMANGMMYGNDFDDDGFWYSREELFKYCTVCGRKLN